jgi:hypothetical protein
LNGPGQPAGCQWPGNAAGNVFTITHLPELELFRFDEKVKHRCDCSVLSGNLMSLPCFVLRFRHR